MSNPSDTFTIVGKLGRDPEIRTLKNGTRVATLLIKVKESWKDERSGETFKRTKWNKVVVHNTMLCDYAETALGKEMTVYVQCTHHNREWQDDRGETHFTAEIRAHRLMSKCDETMREVACDNFATPRLKTA